MGSDEVVSVSGSLMDPRLGLLAASILLLQLCFHSFLTTIPLELAAQGVPNAMIGVAIGGGALIQIPAAIAAGHGIPTWGAPRVLFLGGLVYLAGAAIAATGSAIAIVSSRMLLGIGVVLVLSAAYTIVPSIVSPRRIGHGIGVVGVADNLGFAIAPLVSTALYGQSGILVPALAAAVCAAGGSFLSMLVIRFVTGDIVRAYGESRRSNGFTLRIERRSLPVLAVVLLTTLYFGVTLAFLPSRTEAVGLNAGLFFSANGLAILLLKLPSGALADRGGWRWLTAAGICLTALAVVALIPAPTASWLVVAGALSGAGAAFTSTACLTTLAHRTAPGGRGRANAAAGVAQSTAIAAGGLVGAPLVSIGGFGLAMVASLVALIGALTVVIRDKWRGPAASEATGAESVGPRPGAIR